MSKHVMFPGCSCIQRRKDCLLIISYWWSFFPPSCITITPTHLYYKDTSRSLRVVGMSTLQECSFGCPPNSTRLICECVWSGWPPCCIMIRWTVVHRSVPNFMLLFRWHVFFSDWWEEVVLIGPIPKFTTVSIVLCRLVTDRKFRHMFVSLIRKLFYYCLEGSDTNNYCLTFWFMYFRFCILFLMSLRHFITFCYCIV